MDDLAARVEALEVGATFEATQQEVQRIQYDLLLKLREIRAGLQANQGGGLLSATTATELEALKAENGALKLKNSKLEYRVEIMKSSIEELLAAQKPSKA
jgi:predicted  nucleic acid-binding Zn-ribbon protein